ncbi:hypothetical protein H4219_006379, partial [Mycoemilia scoparia]
TAADTRSLAASSIQNQELSKEDIDRYKEAFQLFDQGNDGCINRQDLAVTIRSLGFIISEQEVDAIYSSLNKSGNGVEFPDFLSMMAARKKEDPDDEKELTETFKVFDQDGDGWIDGDDLARALSSIGERMPREEVDELIKAANVSGSGKLSYEEFVKLL